MSDEAKPAPIAILAEHLARVPPGQAGGGGCAHFFSA